MDLAIYLPSSWHGARVAVWVACSALIPLRVAADDAPFVVVPPVPPEMTHTPENSSIGLMNRVLEPLSPDAQPPPADLRNLEGVWTNAEPYTFRIRTTMTGVLIPFNAEGARIVTARVEADNAGTPLANAATSCRPAGQSKQIDLNFPFRIFQGKGEIDVVFEEYHSIWQIRMDQPHHLSARREYSGDSIGHWDGDTLVVETTGFKLPMWLDTAGTPVGEDATVTRRIRKIEGGRALEIITTIDDPRHYTQPWSFARKMLWRPDRYLAEYNCEKQIGDDAGNSAYGLQRQGGG